MVIAPPPSLSKTDPLIAKYLKKASNLEKQNKYAEAEMVFAEGLKKFPRSVELYYFRAKFRHYSSGNIMGAISDYTYVIRINPKYNSKAFWRRGVCLYRLKLYELAIKDYTKNLEYMPDYDRVYMARAMAYGKLRRFDEAIRDLRSAVKFGPEYKLQAEYYYRKFLVGDTDY